MSSHDINTSETRVRGTLFGIPISFQEASLILIPVPWEVTISGESGTALAPERILNHSYQIDLYHPHYANGWKVGMGMYPFPYEWKMLSDQLRRTTQSYIHALEMDTSRIGFNYSAARQADYHAHKLKEKIKQKAMKVIEQNKMVGLVGGEHSSALGLVEACATAHDQFGVLHLSAHANLREAHQGFDYSYASIMYNVLKIPQVAKMVHVGLRDYCQEEALLMQSSQKRMDVFSDYALKKARFQGEKWQDSCRRIIATLPEKVYISFSINALQPTLCPNTSKPVPGGFDFQEVAYLLETIVESGKKIIGFDLSDVAAEEDVSWDALVGARMLYELGLCIAASQGRLDKSDLA